MLLIDDRERLVVHVVQMILLVVRMIRHLIGVRMMIEQHIAMVGVIVAAKSAVVDRRTSTSVKWIRIADRPGFDAFPNRSQMRSELCAIGVHLTWCLAGWTRTGSFAAHNVLERLLVKSLQSAADHLLFQRHLR